MIKKGVILAGGTGSRLAPMTKVTNKHLLPVYNKPMIYYPIETLKRSGITELLIITGTESAGDFMKLLGSGDSLGVHITFRVQEGSAGIADALQLAENFVGDEDFAVILGDNIYEESFEEVFQNFTGGAHIFLKEVFYADRFGVATLSENNEVLKIVEKPKNPETNFAVTGLYVYDASVFQKLKILTLSERGEYEITDINQQYIDDKNMTASFLKQGWNDAGTHESLFYASKLARDMDLGIKKTLDKNIASIEKITIGIILYKNEKYLEQCLRSLLSQSYSNFELLLKDQDENSFEALEYLKTHCIDILQDERVKVFSGKNVWHSGGHNFLISEMSADSTAYVCASNDMIYDKKCIETLVNELNNNLEYSVAVPKLKRWNFDNQQDNEGKTDFLDSCGIGLYENHHFFDIGQGEKDTGQYDNIKEVFGGSGALFLVRKKSLEHVAYKKNDDTFEFFDENIHYKNDIDLAYRLWWADEKSCFVPEAVAFHDRQVCNSKGSAGNMGLIQKIIRNNKNKSLWVKESSFFGHLVLLYKNACCMGLPFRVQVKILWYLFRATGFLLITEPKVLLQYKKFWNVLPNIRSKKTVMVKQKKVSAYMLQKFF